MDLKNVLILSDYDCTFTGKDGKLVKRNIEAVDELKSHGGYFTFSTGRLPKMIKEICPTYRDIVNRQIILANGAIIFDPFSDKTLQTSGIDGNLSRQIIRSVYDKFEPHHFVIYPVSDGGVFHQCIDPSSDLIDGDYIKFAFYMNSEADAVGCRDFIRQNYNDRANCFRSFSPYPEVVDKSVSKGSMIPKLIQYLGGKRSDFVVCCIGDYENDVPMLQEADISFCPDNALPEVKAMSDHIVCHHEYGALADMIKIIKKL